MVISHFSTFWGRKDRLGAGEVHRGPLVGREVMMREPEENPVSGVQTGKWAFGALCPEAETSRN